MSFFKKNKFSLIFLFIIFVVMFISLGYAASNINLTIDEILSYVRVGEDIRITGINVDNASDDVISNYEEYNKNSISSSFSLPNSDSSITYKIEITNFEGQVMGISGISGLPDNLEYSINGYTLKDRICDNSNKCNLGIKKDIYITIKYKNGGYDSNNVNYEIDLLFNFAKIFNINYVNIENNNYLQYIIDGSELSLDFSSIEDTSNIRLYYNENEYLTLGEDYNFVDGRLIVYSVIDNLTIEKIESLVNEKTVSLEWASFISISSYDSITGVVELTYVYSTSTWSSITGNVTFNGEIVPVIRFDTSLLSFVADEIGEYKISIKLVGKSGEINISDTLYVEIENESLIPLDDGMIPVKIANDGTVTTVSSTDSSWYNYDNKEWANAVLVKEEGTQLRSYYKNNPNVTIPEEDILAYYVWIPRYKYKIWTVDATTTTSPQTIDIEFESKTTSVSSGTTVGSWKTHPAFIWDGQTVAGIWVGKFETGHTTLSSSTTSNNLSCTDENCVNSDGLIIKPNVVSLRRNNVSNQFYASRSMSRSGNSFGLSSSTVDSHVMKNSEWGAVAYLSHSEYGVNTQIRINNNSSYTTGCGASAEDGSSTSSCQIAYGGATSYPQSTTGNISGVFDMSGGAYEIVMGNYNNVIKDSGFTTMPSSKYYDLYSSTQFTGDYDTNMILCTIETCGGHALFETAGWYSDYKTFVQSHYSWFLRSSYHYNGSRSGAFTVYNWTGNSVSYNSWRSVLVVR